MKTQTRIFAATPAWNEPSELLELCQACAADAVDRHYVFEGGVERLTGGPWKTQAAMRDHGRQWAQKRGARWLLQLDADELLINGQLLRPILERWLWPAYPIPLVQEHDGQTTLAPFKLLRLPARIVAHSEYVQLSRPGRMPPRSAPIHNLAGYTCPPELRRPLLELPFLLHVPGRRPGIRRAERLSRWELSLEPRPPDAIAWPLPPLTLTRGRFPVKTEADGTPREYEASDGDYACPGCGARYDTPGICEGSSEAGHEPTPVKSVKESVKELAKSAKADAAADAAVA